MGGKGRRIKILSLRHYILLSLIPIYGIAFVGDATCECRGQIAEKFLFISLYLYHIIGALSTIAYLVSLTAKCN
jgi:hypothetical protein